MESFKIYFDKLKFERDDMSSFFNIQILDDISVSFLLFVWIFYNKARRTRCGRISFSVCNSMLT